MRVLHVIAKKNGVSNPALVAQCKALTDYLSSDLFTYETGSILAYVKATQLLANTIRNGKYDIIHAHYSRSGLMALLASRGVPVVVSFMGTDMLGRNILNKVIKIVIELRSRHIIVRSREMADKLLSKNNFSTIPNGVHMGMFRPLDRKVAREALNLSPDNKYILFAANPNRREKNVKLAKEACRLLKTSHENLELLTISNKPHGSLSLYLNACDTLLLTSLYEGSPCIIKEAMACNCPIVATDVGDVREVIGQTVGCYVTSFDSEDIAAKVGMAISFDKRTLGREAVAHLEQHTIAKRLGQLYEQVVVSSE